MKTITLPVEKNTHVTIIGTREHPVHNALYRVAKDEMIDNRGSVIYMTIGMGFEEPAKEFNKFYGLDVLSRIRFYFVPCLTVYGSGVVKSPKVYVEGDKDFLSMKFYELERRASITGGFDGTTLLIVDNDQLWWHGQGTYNKGGCYSEDYLTAYIQTMISFAKKHGVSVATAFPEDYVADNEKFFETFVTKAVS